MSLSCTVSEITARYWPKIADLNLLHLYLTPPLEVTPPEFGRNLRRQKNQSPRAILRRCLRDPTFSRFGTVPACDEQTDGRTDGHMMTSYTALA